MPKIESVEQLHEAVEKSRQAALKARRERGAIRHGPAVDQTQAEELRAREAEGTVLSSNGQFTKVIRDGVVAVIPTVDAYSKEPDERDAAIEVADSTVSEVKLRPVNDRAEREFGKQDLREAISVAHAQRGEGAIGEAKELAGVNAEENKERAKEALAESNRETTEKLNKASKEEEDALTEETDSAFDLSNPRATTLANLAAELEVLSDADVKKARKNDDRAGAEAIYAKRLGE